MVALLVSPELEVRGWPEWGAGLRALRTPSPSAHTGASDRSIGRIIFQHWPAVSAVRFETCSRPCELAKTPNVSTRSDRTS